MKLFIFKLIILGLKLNFNYEKNFLIIFFYIMERNLKYKQDILKNLSSKSFDYFSIYEKYKKEFIDNCDNILNENEDIFLTKFYNKMHLIFNDIFDEDIYDNKDFQIIKNKAERNFYNDIYKKMYNPCYNAIKKYNQNKKNVTFLSDFINHCNYNKIPIHTCKGQFIIITEQYNKNKILYVTCSNCKMCYYENSILMYCEHCKEEFYSLIISQSDKILPPATWEKYHCNVLFCEQMSCIKCGEKFFLKNNNLYCKKCKFLINPMDIFWKCIVCKKEFQSYAKVFNPLEYKILNLAVKNALIYKKIMKPKEMKCKCYKESELSKINFNHKNSCKGILYHGILSNKDIVVCSKCKVMSFLDKFIWFCPCCKIKFKCSKFYIFDKNNIINDNNNDSNDIKNENDNNDIEDNNENKKNDSVIDDNNHINNLKKKIINKHSRNVNHVLSFGSLSELHEKLFKSMRNIPSNFNSKLNHENVSKITLNQNEENEKDNIKDNEDNTFIKNEKKIKNNLLNENLKGNLKLNLKNILNQKKEIKTPSKERCITEREENQKSQIFQNKYNLTSRKGSVEKLETPLKIKKIKHVKLNSLSKINFFPKNNGIKNEQNKIKDLLHLIYNDKEKEKNSSPLKTESKLLKNNLSKINHSNSKKIIIQNKITLKNPLSNEEIFKKKISLNIENTKENNHLRISSEELSQQERIHSRINSEELNRKKNNFLLNEFNFDDFTIITQIGQGTFGKIYLVQDLKGKLYSMKKIILSDEIELSDLIKEYNLCNKLVHPNIIKILGLYKNKLDKTTYVIYILMEVGITDWEKEIKNNSLQKKFYKEEDLILILKQLCSALSFLQRKRISHRDIKPQNILVFNNKIYKLADFGEAKQILFCNDRNTLKGTELYMSPLLYNGLRTNQIDIKHNLFKSDVYSLGLCILYAATFNINYLYKIRKYINMNVVRSFIFDLLKKNYSQHFINLLCLMLDINEDNRPDFLEMERILKYWK